VAEAGVMEARYSPEGAVPFSSPAHIEATDAAKLALQSAVEEFERKTGRFVDSIHMSHIDATSMNDSEPRLVREFHISVLFTAAEEKAGEDSREAWRLYLAGEGPHPMGPE
jgi:hypothetical protein